MPRKIFDIVKTLCKDGKTIRALQHYEWGKRGCILSPILFPTVLDRILRRALRKTGGIQWRTSERFEDLRTKFVTSSSLEKK